MKGFSCKQTIVSGVIGIAVYLIVIYFIGSSLGVVVRNVIELLMLLAGLSYYKCKKG